MNRNNNNKIITRKDYELLELKENAKPKEIKAAYEKLYSEYHPEKIKLELLREPTEFEIKKFKEIEKVYEKFDFEPSKWKCCGYRKDINWHCTNMFYPCLWKKVKGGQEKYYCSQECYNSKFERPDDQKSTNGLKETKLREIQNTQSFLARKNTRTEDLEPNNRNWQQEINNVGEQWSIENFQKIINIRDRVEQEVHQKKQEKNKKRCDYCGEKIEPRQEGESNSYWVGIGSVDHEGNRYTFCSDECCQKGAGSKAKGIVNKHAFTKLLQWMEKEGITNIYLDPDSKKLTIKYGENNSKTVEDNNLTPEQKEIKKYFQQVGKNSLSQQEVREEIKGKNKGGDSGLVSVIVVGIVVVIATLIGVIIYKHKKKGY